MLKYNYKSLQAFLLSLIAMRYLLHFTPIVGYSDFYANSAKAITFISMLIYFNHLKQLNFKKQPFEEIILITIMFFFVFVFVVKFDLINFASYMAFMWSMFLIVTSSREILNLAFGYFRTIFVITLIPSILLYPLIATGLSPVGEIVPIHEIKEQLGWYYKNYLFSFQLIDYFHQDGALFYRMSGLFDEAGVVGTFSALFLIVDRYSKNMTNAILIAAGFLSFSFAFYVMTLIYFLFSLKISKILAAALFALPLFFVLQSNSFVQERLLDRFSVSEGKFAGDNRANEEFDRAYTNFIDSSQIWMGVENQDSYAMGAASWKNLLWDYGIIGSTLLLLFFVLYATSNVKGDLKLYWPFLAIFALNIYQRPHVFDPAYVLIFASGIAYIAVNHHTKQPSPVALRT
ncbi:MAG: hypothetical protein Q7T54_02105 [Candidatus Levybacteria bacterium]|nr:hypothetical protein [Candidatus Levybacteria bacterium]